MFICIHKYTHIRTYECTDASCSSSRFLSEDSGYWSMLSLFTSTSESGYMLVWFSSDGGVTAGGFTASWTSSTPAIPVSYPATFRYCFT